MNELCPHGRHKGAVCLDCGYSQPNDWEAEDLRKQEDFKIVARKNIKKTDQPSGLDAPYYDFPDNIHSAMDLIEWLDLDFSQGNILKSIIRENNPNAKKETSKTYEAQKRFYYAERGLRQLSEVQEEL